MFKSYILTLITVFTLASPEEQNIRATFQNGTLKSTEEMQIPKKINKNNVDLSVVAGLVKFNGSLCRQTITLLETVIPHNINANIIGRSNIGDIENKQVLNILKQASKSNQPGNVAILEDVIYTKKFDGFATVPKNSHIRLAYTMFESSRIPQVWVNRINQLDGAIVPDEYIKKAYIKSGVTVPIFVVPLGAYLHKFLELPGKTGPNKKFTFGCIAMEISRKNLEMLINSFAQTFGQNKDVQLVLKLSYSGESRPGYLESLAKKAKRQNIKISRAALNWQEYVKLMESFDCYAYISKGEGFSVTPRESIAAGIPTIITNNTAQKTICKSGIVKIVESKIKEPAKYFWFNDTDLQQCGHQFNCQQEDVCNALLDVYSNYNHWLEKAQNGRNWAEQYLPENLSLKYLNIIKPTKIILGSDNIVTDEYLMTNNENLLKKYIQLQT